MPTPSVTAACTSLSDTVILGSAAIRSTMRTCKPDTYRQTTAHACTYTKHSMNVRSVSHDNVGEPASDSARSRSASTITVCLLALHAATHLVLVADVEPRVVRDLLEREALGGVHDEDGADEVPGAR